MEMVRDLNERAHPQVPEREEAPVTIECKTCHRGLARPLLLRRELRFIIDRHGVDSALARYRELRERDTLRGMFDSVERESNTLAEVLARDGRPREAIAIYQLNREFFPASSSITFDLGRLYEQVGDTALAVEYYQRTLTINQNHRSARQGLERLRRQP
jgi:tetratricopeptide (TPR) repeat protein